MSDGAMSPGSNEIRNKLFDSLPKIDMNESVKKRCFGQTPCNVSLDGMRETMSKMDNLLIDAQKELASEVDDNLEKVIQEANDV